MNWHGSPELLQIGFLHLRWYGVLFAIAFICAYRITRKMVFQDGMDQKQLDYLLWTVMASTVIGARLGHCLFYQPELFLHDPIRILKVWEGGLASHGAAIGITLGVWIYTRRIRLLSFLQVYDRIIVPVPLGGFLIRTGNFFNSEILGKPSTVPWAVTFANVDQIPRHPAQLYEALIYLILFFFLYRYYWKTNARQFVGRIFGWGLIGIFSARFFVEFFKENQEAFENNLPINMGQILSIPCIAIGIYLIVSSKRREVSVPLGTAVSKKSKR